MHTRTTSRVDLGTRLHISYRPRNNVNPGLLQSIYKDVDLSTNVFVDEEKRKANAEGTEYSRTATNLQTRPQVRWEWMVSQWRSTTRKSKRAERNAEYEYFSQKTDSRQIHLCRTRCAQMNGEAVSMQKLPERVVARRCTRTQVWFECVACRGVLRVGMRMPANTRNPTGLPTRNLQNVRRGRVEASGSNRS